VDLQEHAESLDGIIDSVSAQHEIAAEIGLLKIDGKLIMLGAPPQVTSAAPVGITLLRGAHQDIAPTNPLAANLFTTSTFIPAHILLFSASLQLSCFSAASGVCNLFPPHKEEDYRWQHDWQHCGDPGDDRLLR